MWLLQIFEIDCAFIPSDKQAETCSHKHVQITVTWVRVTESNPQGITHVHNANNICKLLQHQNLSLYIMHITS